MNIDKDNRSRHYFQKAKGTGCSKTKRQAALDISEECGDNKFFTRNYIGIEHIVLKACSCNMQIISIYTNLI